MNKNLFQLVLASSMLLIISSCQKELIKPEISSEEITENNNNSNQVEEKKIYVATLDELYAAVNDPDNAGTDVILAPGNYVLSSAYPNGGRLELQTDMTIQGQPGDPEAVVIDQSLLPTASFVIPAGRTGGIRMGKGTNVLEWLSLIGGVVSANPFSVINTDLLSTETTIKILHVNVNVNGCNIGINLRNRLAEHAGRKIFAELQDNEVTGAINFNGLAIAAQIANGASESLIKVNMKNNFIHGNKIGLLAFSSAQTATVINSTIEIISRDDRIEGNGCGLDLTGGVNQASTTFANNNTTTIKMFGSSISNNNPPGASQLQPVNGALPGAMYVASGYNTVNNIAGYNRASNNIMKVECWGSTILNNGITDINAYGAWCQPVCVLAGTNNLTEINLYGNSAKVTLEATASVPTEVAGTNVVNVFQN